jgi:pimeloyl-ACP methyl ester carboxylesterase
LALRLPGDTLGRDALRSVEETPEWLFAPENLAPEEEARRAAEVREQLLDGQAAAPTPDAARRVFDRLIAELPPRLKPPGFHYRLTILDWPEREAFTAGGGEIFVSRPEADDLLNDPPSCPPPALGEGRVGEAALAFALAVEIGHNALGQTRRAWEWHDAVAGVAGFVPFARARKALTAAFAGAPGRFAYSLPEREDADCFALHLCRNAGFDPDATLDSLRLAARGHLSDKDDGLITEGADGPLFRLKRMLMERDGLFDDETTHGLFIYDRESGRLARCGPHQVGAGERPIVFVHGLRGTQYAFDAYLYVFGKRPELAGRPLLVFRYPNNESLSRCGEFLTREMRRCVVEPDKAIFVCHSAGGLVFRWYAEVRGGGFDRAIFLATPHAGTRLAGFTFFVAVYRFCSDLPYGLDFTFADAFGEGSGQIAQDLEPDSLFLRRLNREKPPVEKYQIFYGELFDYWRGVWMQAQFFIAMQYVKDAVPDLIPCPRWQTRARRWMETAMLPDEIAHGDGAVSAASARLPGVKATSIPLSHEGFRLDPGMVRRVLDVILKP